MDDGIIQTGRDVLRIAAENISNAERSLGAPFRDAVYALHRTKGSIVVCGIGKSGIIAKKVSATLSSTGTRSCFIHPSEAFHGDFGIIEPEDTLILFSHSGETAELIKFLNVVRNLHEKNTVITITAKSNSTLALNSDLVVLTHVSKENHDDELKHMPTTSTTVTLALGDALALSVQKLRGFKAEHFFRFHPGGNIGKIASEVSYVK
jgi:arabinose-5-phosphate isomerase